MSVDEFPSYDPLVVRKSLRSGGVYLTFSGDYDTPFKFAKILSIEDDQLWLKCYYDNFYDQPTLFEKASLLSGARIIPLSIDAFLSCGPPKFPILVATEPVTDDELSQRVPDYYNHPKCRD